MRILCTLFIWVSPIVLLAQSADQPRTKSLSGDRWQATYFRQRVEAIESACLKDIDTLEKWEARRKRDREALFDMLGLWPLPEKTELKAETTGKVERERFTVEKIHFQSRPQLYVTGNLYLPKGIDKPAPAILYLCGHGAVKKDGVSYGNKVYYQHHGAWFAEHGYVCLIIDSLQLGEIEGIHHGTYRENMWWWNALGYTPAGVEAWNCIRALDYLETRPEVDRQRMGATGRSGGGAYSWWIAALDDRIKAAAPVAGITDLRNHVIDGAVEGHCDCMFFSNSHRWDYANVAALVAPRPLLIANSDSDKIFPLDGVLRVYGKTRRIYKLYDAADKLGLQISPGPHKDTQELQMAAFKFFDKYLRGEERIIDRAAIKLFEPEELKVFEKLPSDQRNTVIQESFTRRFAAPASLTQGQWNAQSRAWQQALAAKVLAYWPDEPLGQRTPPRTVSSSTSEKLRLTRYDLAVHDGLSLPLFQLEDIAVDKPAGALLQVVDEEGWKTCISALRGIFPGELGEFAASKADEAALTAMRQQLQDGPLFFFPPRNIGPTASNPAAKEQVQLRRRYNLLGESLEGMQAWDVHCAVFAMRSIVALAEVNLRVRAQGDLAAVALYGALGRLPMRNWQSVGPWPQLELVSPPASHRAGAPLFHVLRYFDMPQAVMLAAEHGRVTLIDVDEEQWRFAVETAKNLNRSDRLTIVAHQAAESK